MTVETIGAAHYLIVSGILFCLGLTGVMLRRNMIVMLMSIELMLNASNVTFVALSRFPISSLAQFPEKGGAAGMNALAGHASAFFVIATAAAEAAVGLAILIAIFRKRQTAHVDEMTLIRDPAFQPEATGPAAPAPVAAHAESH